MSATTETETQVALAPPKVIAGPPKVRKLRPARKQVKPGEVEKKEAPQTGKEYSAYDACCRLEHPLTALADIWYNKWAGGDREDSYSKYVADPPVTTSCDG